MSIKRSEFLRLSSWGLVASLLPMSQINALSHIKYLKTSNPDDYAVAVQKAEEAKEAFYRRNYSLAEELYLECIALAPADIRFYDNLQNVYGAQGKWLTSVELFKNGLKANGERVSFYDRAARSLMRLELGYKSDAENYRKQIDSESLLNDAAELYNRAISIDPAAKYLLVGLDKVRRKIEEDAVNIDYRENKAAKDRRKAFRRIHRQRYNVFSLQHLEEKIAIINDLKRQTLFFEGELKNRENNIVREKKLLHRLIAKIYEDEVKDLDKAISHNRAILEIDAKDTRALQQLKRLYIKSSNYRELENLQRIQVSKKETVYSYLGLVKALKLRYVHETKDARLLEESLTICAQLIGEWDLRDSIKAKIIGKLSEIHVLVNSHEKAKLAIESFVEENPKLSAGDTNNLIFSYAKIYFENEAFADAISIIKIGLKNADELQIKSFETIADLVSKNTKTDFNDNLILYYLLYNVYNRLGDEENMNDVIQTILKNNPEDKFALKHQNK